MSSVETAGGRGERRGRRPARAAGAIDQLPAKQPRNLMRPVELVSADELESIHEAALTILEEIGMDVLLPEAREIYREAGAKVDGQRVRADRGLVLEAVAKAPERFRMHARNPARNLEVGGEYMMFSPVASPPNCSDLEHGRRPGNRADFRDFLKLGQTFNILHLTGGYTVEPIDIPPDIRHLEALRDIYTLTDKPTHSYSLGWGRIRDGIEMCRIARGIDRAQLEREPSLMTIINTSSPLRLDSPMAAGIIEMAKAGQIVVLTPFTLAGAMAPVTVAGAVAQQNAEALLGHRPGAAGATGRAGDLWRIHQQRRHEVGCPRLRHARIHEGGPARRPAGAPLPPALPHFQHHRGQLGRRPGDVRVGVLALGCGDGRRQPDQALGGLARGGTVLLVREAGDRRRHAADGGLVPGAATGRRVRPWHWMRSARLAQAAISSAATIPKPATALPSMLPSSPTGATTRAGARPAHPTPRATPTASTRNWWPPSSHRRSIRRSRRSLTPSSTAGSAKAARPASSERGVRSLSAISPCTGRKAYKRLILRPAPQ